MRRCVDALVLTCQGCRSLRAAHRTGAMSQVRYGPTRSDVVVRCALQNIHLHHIAPSWKDKLTVPHANSAVAAAAHQCVSPELHRANKVLVHLPRPIGIRRCGNCKGPCSSSCTRNEVSRDRGARYSRRRVRDRPEDVHRHDALARREIPLPHRLVRRARDLVGRQALTCDVRNSIMGSTGNIPGNRPRNKVPSRPSSDPLTHVYMVPPSVQGLKARRLGALHRRWST